MHYTDVFGGERVQMLSSEPVSYKPVTAATIPKYKSLSRPVDNITLDLPPTGAAPVTPGTDKVSQKYPDFLIDGDGVLLVYFAREKDVIPGSDSEELIPDAVQYPILSVLLLKEVQNHELTIQKQAEQIELLNDENKDLQQRLKKLEELLLK